MSHQHFTNLRCSWGNYIPSGRQIPRTPPSATIHNEDFKLCPAKDPDTSDRTRTCDFNSLEAKTAAGDPTSMLKGMKGYQLTPGDLEFINNMKEEQLVKKLEGDLKKLQEQIKMERMALELARASKETTEAELNTFPSCEEVSEWMKLVLRKTSPLTDLTDLDSRSLLALVTIEDVQSFMDEKTTEVTQMRKMVANKIKKEAEERGQLEKQLANKQLKIQTLMRELCDLKSELAQQEEACKLKLKPTKSVKTAAGKQKKVKEQEFSSQEAVRAVRERRKNTGAAQYSAAQPKNQRQVKAGEALSPASGPNNQPRVKSGEGESTSQQRAPKRSRKKSTVAAHVAGQETQNAGLRRSKRVANRR